MSCTISECVVTALTSIQCVSHQFSFLTCSSWQHRDHHNENILKSFLFYFRFVYVPSHDTLLDLKGRSARWRLLNALSLKIIFLWRNRSRIKVIYKQRFKLRTFFVCYMEPGKIKDVCRGKGLTVWSGYKRLIQTSCGTYQI